MIEFHNKLHRAGTTCPCNTCCHLISCLREKHQCEARLLWLGGLTWRPGQIRGPYTNTNTNPEETDET